MSSHPDADAFVRGYLRTPTDATTRLVFADWLEETGTASNVAWAHYIRARADADRHELQSPERSKCAARAAEHAPDIRARLTISAKLFVGYPKSLLELLPAPNIAVRLADYAIPQAVLELMPESVARENLVLPLDLHGWVLLVVTADPRNRDTVEKLEFILNKDVVAVRGEAEDIQAAIDRQYGQTEVESVDSVLYEYTNPPPFLVSVGPATESEAADMPVVRLVNLILREGIDFRADRVEIDPKADHALVRYRVGGRWVDRGRLPLRVFPAAVDRIALMGLISRLPDRPEDEARGRFPMNAYGLRLTVRVVIRRLELGHHVELELDRSPVPAL